MPSYVITGVSRGIGYEFLRQYSSDPSNFVIGIVRDKAATETKIAKDADLNGRTNIHILQADLTDYSALRAAVDASAKLTGGSLDYLIGNAGLVPQFDAYAPIGVLCEQPEAVNQTLREVFDINVTANVHLLHLFTPLLLKGQAKKAVIISSGMADTELARNYDIETASIYAASKAAVNMIVAKFSAQYKKDGLLFLALCPGMVDVGHFSQETASPKQQLAMGDLMAKFVRYAPHFKGPDTPEQSVTAVRKVIAEASIEKGNGGDFLSHYGTKTWL